MFLGFNNRVRTAHTLHPMLGFARSQAECVPQGTHTVSVGKDQILETNGFWDGSGFCRIQVSDLRLAENERNQFSDDLGWFLDFNYRVCAVRTRFRLGEIGFLNPTVSEMADFCRIQISNLVYYL